MVWAGQSPPSGQEAGGGDYFQQKQKLKCSGRNLWDTHPLRWGGNLPAEGGARWYFGGGARQHQRPLWGQQEGAGIKSCDGWTNG